MTTMHRLALLTGLALLARPAKAEEPPKPATATFDKDAPGGPPSDFEPVVGDWYAGEAGGQKGLMVDGTRWRHGTPSANLADQAKRLYGDRYAEFLDGVKAFAFFPLAVWKGQCPAGDQTLSMKFFPIAGRIDQGAGIAWSIAPDGSYLGARANALEDNLLFFKVVRGKRTIIDTVRGVQTATRTWHRLVVALRGKEMVVSLDGKERLRKQLEAAPGGRCGLWSKADSKVLFDDFTITASAAGNQ